MSDDEQLKTYEVELTMTATAYVTVEAVDEDEAHDLAKQEGYALPTREWDVDLIRVENVKDMAA